MEMTNGKAAGAHKIPAEVRKHGSPILHKALLDPVTFCWENKVLPQDFKVTKIIIICKSKGDRHNCSNYCGILLFSITGRLLGKLLLKRFQVIADDVLPKFQCGFHSSHSMADMIFSLCQLQEQAAEQEMSSYVAFVDLSKAFDYDKCSTVFLQSLAAQTN
ncbi:unnamed protein product [Caretta caretta]